MEEKSIIAIEIGSSKVRGAIGTYSPTGVLTVQAVEEEPLLEWVRYGAVSNIEEVSALLGRIIRKIENRVSPRKVSSVYVGIGGRSFCSLPRDVEQTFAEDSEITDDVIAQLVRDAALSPYADREMLMVVPREFIVDKTVVSRPKGTVGRTIRMSANLIACRPQLKRNIDRLFTEKMKLNVAGYKVRQLALADVVLNSDEKRLGCMLVDFGAETTAVSIYKHGYLQYLVTLPMGSRNITRDIMKLNYLEERAEELKCTVGNATGASAVADGSLSMASTDYSDVNNYVSHRAGEIIANIRKQLEYSGFTSSDLPGGIIIVGGGARLNGFNECLSKRLAMHLRVGSVSRPDIRIPDSRLSLTDTCDVIAVLYRAAADGAEECLTMPQRPDVAEPQPAATVVEPEPEPEPVIEEIAPSDPEPAGKKAGKKWFKFNFDSIKNKVENLMTERDYDDDYRDD